MLLVQIFPGETETAFRLAIDSTLQSIDPKRRGWWHPYELRGCFEYHGIRFRHFFCIASSVQAWLWITAARHGGQRRVIWLPNEQSEYSVGPVLMYGSGEEIVVQKNDVVPSEVDLPSMPDQEPIPDSKPPKRRRSGIFAMMMNCGLLFACIVALAIIGFFWLADHVVNIRNGH